MTTRLTRALVAAAGLVLTVAVTGCGSDSGDGSSGAGGGGLPTLQEGTLKVCSDVPYAPFDILEGDTFTGFDGDLVTELAAGLDLALVVQDSGFHGLQSGIALDTGLCDLAASAMTITPEREDELDFTEGYYDSEQSLLVPRGSDIASIDDLAGQRVGVQESTTGEAYAEANAPDDAAIISFPSDAEMFNAIKAGRIDALLQDLGVNVAHTEDRDFEIVEEYDTGEEYGFAVKQGNTALLEAVDEELARMREDGTYDRIYDTYFATG